MRPDQEQEKQIIESFEKDELRRVKHVNEERQRYRDAARAAFSQSKKINIRLSERDLVGLNQRSLEEGISRQSLVSSVLHKYISRRLVEKTE